MVGIVETSKPIATRWNAVFLLVATGVVAALQVGKVAIAAPVMQEDLGIGLAAIGWLTGIFAVLGLIGGIFTGAFTASFGSRRVLVLGLLTIAAGAAMGALATTLPILLLSRVIEGAGFLMITVAAPSILGHVTERAHRDLAFGLWSCFMPVGMTLAMLTGPLFEGWRAMWWASSATTLGVCLAVMFAIPATGERLAWSWRSLLANTLAVVRTGGLVVLAIVFALYSLVFFALFSFLPVLLMERMEVTHKTAGLLSAFATISNILGNLAAGYLLSNGIRRASLLAGTGLVMGVTGLGIFLPVLPNTTAFVLCVVFSAVGGLIPATLLASAPLAAPTASLTPVVLGLIVQGNNLGQIVGPIAIGSAIERFGWESASILVACATLFTAGVAMRLRRMSWNSSE